MRNAITKTLSILISGAIAVGSFPTSAGAVESAAVMPEFVKTLTPPANLGFVDSYYQGSTQHPVVLIQDLHANVGVQNKIQGILEDFQPKIGGNGSPMVLGMEGAWGDVSFSPLQAANPKVRKKAADFLLKNAEISGMEHFAVMSNKEVKIVGIDNPADYILHSELFKQSLAARLSLAKKTDKLRYAVNSSKGSAPRELQRLWKAEENFHAGNMSLADLSKKLDVELTNYRQAEEVIAKQKAAIAKKVEGEQGFLVKNVTEADQNLSLLSRLLREQLTLEEVQYASKRVPAMLLTVQALLPGENIALWNDTVRSAIDHYAIAILRDKPLAEHALELAQKYTDRSVVVVTGGFHTAGIERMLKAKKISYVAIAPVVESHTAKDEALYLTRMMDIHVTDVEIANGMQVRPSAHTRAAPSVIFNYLGANPQASLARSVNARTVLPEVLAAASGETLPPTPQNQITMAKNIADLTTPEVDLKKTDNIVKRAWRQVVEFVKGPEMIPMQDNAVKGEESASASTEVKLNGDVASAPVASVATGEAAAKSAAESRGKAPLLNAAGVTGVTALGIGAIMTKLPLQELAAHASRHTINADIGSNAIGVAIAIGGAAVVGFFSTPKGKKVLSEARRKAAFAIAA